MTNLNFDQWLKDNGDAFVDHVNTEYLINVMRLAYFGGAADAFRYERDMERQRTMEGQRG